MCKNFHELLCRIILLDNFWTIFSQPDQSAYSSARIYHENYFEVRLTVIRPLCKKLLFCNNKGLSMSVYLNLFRLYPDTIRIELKSFLFQKVVLTFALTVRINCSTGCLVLTRKILDGSQG